MFSFTVSELINFLLHNLWFKEISRFLKQIISSEITDSLYLRLAETFAKSTWSTFSPIIPPASEHTCVQAAVAIETSQRVQTLPVRNKTDSGPRTQHGSDEIPLLCVRIEDLRWTQHFLTVETADYVNLSRIVRVDSRHGILGRRSASRPVDGNSGTTRLILRFTQIW